MKKSPVLTLLFCAFALLASFVYGIVVMEYQVFPFEQLRALKRVAQSEIPHTQYYELKKSFFDHQKVPDTDVVFVGDSLTDIAEWGEMFPSLVIANRGISTDRTDGVLQRLDTIYNTSAEHAFVMLGVNDFIAGVPVDTTFDNYRFIVETLVEKDMRVYVQSTLHTGKNFAHLNSQIASLNEKLSVLARQFESVVYINLNKKLAPDSVLSDEYSRDGIHLNGVGYKVWKNTISPYLGSDG